MKRSIKYILLISFLVAAHINIEGQEIDDVEEVSENIRGKGRVVDQSTIKLRWAPTTPKAWLHGRNYGYSVERYTVMVDNKWQDNPTKVVLASDLKVTPLPQWEEQALKSDYAAVIAQAFYGEDFELNTTANDVGSIINRSSELEQRFATSVFMAEYDYKAAELAGWALTDNNTKEDEKYLYRIILNRPIKQEGDTAAIFIGFADKEELLPPMELNIRWGDKSAMLMWNYELRAREYHSYHVEKSSIEEGGKFQRITELPVTVLNADMQEAFHIDTLMSNEIEYSYRIVGLTSFGEEGPPSNVVSGHGEKQASCIPQIYSGEFVSETAAQIFWEFKCDEINLVDRLQLVKSEKIDGDYSLFIDNIDKQKTSFQFDLKESLAYLKLQAVNKDSTRTLSYPFRLQKIDSIPPAIPVGLEVIIDTLGVAHLSWDANTESDLRGYRILRSFAEGNEKSVLTPQLVTENSYSDILSLSLNNPKVYYSLTALDMRYNESEASPEVAALKPNNDTPFAPLFLNHEVVENKVTLGWMVDSLNADLSYILMRNADDSIHSKILYTGDFATNTFVDELEVSGDYTYLISVMDKWGRQSTTPVPLTLFVAAERQEDKVSGLNAYTNRENNYIELSWKKHPKALVYRIYKSEDDKPMSLWKELDANTNKVVDERLSPNTKYTYTILFTTQADGLSKVSSVSVDF